jgi:stage II sporulation protein AA (anti-sigma F factor antagonist)
MEIHEENQGGAAVIVPHGRVDSGSAPELESNLLGHLRAGEKQLGVDLVSVEYISSAGLRVLLMLAKKLQSTGGHLVLCAMPESVRLVFELAGFVPIFEIEETRDAAVARLGSGAPSS